MNEKKNRRKRAAALMLAVCMAAGFPCGIPFFSAPAAYAEAESDFSGRSYDVSKFVLPAGARNLVVVEGFAVNGGHETYAEGSVSDPARYNGVRLTAYHRDSDTGAFTAEIQSAGVMGWGGMSARRTEGDGTTPIGLFKLNTPFGRRHALPGFPADYREIMISERNQYWSETTNRFETSSDLTVQNGERLWEDWARGIYSYCLDFGFNVGNANGDGSALFLHCTKEGKPSTAGCVAIDLEAMAAVLKLYASGDSYIALAPAGQFEGVYAAYNTTGKSPDGTFTASDRQPGKIPTILRP